MDAGHYIVRTLGCKANLSDSQLIEAELQKRGWKPGGNPRLCIVNSCTVTDEADRQSRKMAARLARENPDARVVVTGCAAEVDPERLASSKGIHYVVGNREKPRLVDLILEKLAEPQPESGELLGVTEGYEEILSRHPADRDWPVAEDAVAVPPARLEGQKKTRAFLKIQEGCNSFCTYCIIPYGRGPSRSLRPREILEQVRALVEAGTREVILTGTNIGDYGTDWSEAPAIDELVESILAHTRLERLRISSLDPTEISPRLMELMASESRLCPHFHVSLQSASSRVLRLMKRRYSRTEVERCLKAIDRISTAQPGGVFVGMDVITGFPGETPEAFDETFRALAELPWTRLHVFPYSERQGTPATRLPEAVSPAERSRRARALQELSLQRQVSRYESVLKARPVLGPVLLERGSEESDVGYTPNYLRVLIPKRVEAGARNSLIHVLPERLQINSASHEASFIASPVHS